MSQNTRFPEAAFYEKISELLQQQHITHEQACKMIIKGLKTHFAPHDEEFQAWLRTQGTPNAETFVAMGMKLITLFEDFRRAEVLYKSVNKRNGPTQTKNDKGAPTSNKSTN
jgi:hypothetical protein